MRSYKIFQLKNPEDFAVKLNKWISKYYFFSLMNSNVSRGELNGEQGYLSADMQGFDLLAFAGTKSKISLTRDHHAFEKLAAYHDSTKDWLYGYLAYDLKNSVEQLSSSHFCAIHVPELYFVQPELVFLMQKSTLKIGFLNKTDKEVQSLFEKINGLTCTPKANPANIQLKSRMKKEHYLDSVMQLKKHIQAGDIYEINFCQEYYAENAIIQPLETWLRLNKHSPAPFSCYFKLQDKHLLCASPERFLKKKGNRLVSQPIKGTIRRGKNETEDAALKKQLFHSQKDRSENVMIVDLVRNDLSKTAKKGTVKVEELFGIYSFPQVHQMISTISSELREDVHFIEAIKHAFPMGSMTGAPKVRAMELIEQYENTKRGLYSGAAGYISPEGDFDFNVVIRSILYNQTEKSLSATFGGAITALSDPQQEYEECLLKASAVFAILND